MMTLDFPEFGWIADERHDRHKTRYRLRHRKTLQVRLQPLQATFIGCQESSLLSAVYQGLPPQINSRTLETL